MADKEQGRNLETLLAQTSAFTASNAEVGRENTWNECRRLSIGLRDGPTKAGLSRMQPLGKA